jgi:DNA-binding response OmpR family regulator
MAHEKQLILLVEPERVLSDLIMLNMQRNGFKIKRLESVAEARVALRRSRPSLIILDLFVPDGSGLELLKDIQAKKIVAEAPVIVISSYGFQEIVEQAIQAGASDFILKPFDVDVLTGKVSALILNKSVDHLDS